MEKSSFGSRLCCSFFPLNFVAQDLNRVCWCHCLVGLVSIFVSSFFPCGPAPGAHLSLGFFLIWSGAGSTSPFRPLFVSCSPPPAVLFSLLLYSFPSFGLFAVSRRSLPARPSCSISHSPALSPWLEASRELRLLSVSV
jgi:hypothetical protein